MNQFQLQGLCKGVKPVGSAVEIQVLTERWIPTATGRGEVKQEILTCVAFGKIAEKIEKYAREDRAVVFLGRLGVGKGGNLFIIEKFPFTPRAPQADRGYGGGRRPGSGSNSRDEYRQEDPTENEDNPF